MTYLVTYDLNAPGKKYDEVYQAIKDASDGTWCKPLSSVYIISSGLSAQQVYDKISPYIDRNDNLLVITVTKNAAWYLDADVGNYLNNML